MARISDMNNIKEAPSDDNLACARVLLIDFGMTEEKANEFCHFRNILGLSITKQVVVNELVSKQVDLTGILHVLYLLLILKLDEEVIVKKYSSNLVIKNDNLLVWTETLMEATLMNTMLNPEGGVENEEVIKKIEHIVDRLSQHNDLLENAKYMIHNLCINQGISLPKTEDPAQSHLVDDSVIVENLTL